MITRRNLLWIIPAALIFTFPLWKIPIASFLAPPLPAREKSTSEDGPVKHDFTMTGVTLHQIENDKNTATIRAATAHTGEKPDNYRLEKVDADIYDDNGNLTNVLADKGLYNTIKKQLWLAENVVITSQADGYTMLTDVLHYDGRKRQVICPNPTVLQGDGINIKGSSFQHDMNTGLSTVGGRVYCTLKGRGGS